MDLSDVLFLLLNGLTNVPGQMGGRCHRTSAPSTCPTFVQFGQVSNGAAVSELIESVKTLQSLSIASFDALQLTVVVMVNVQPAPCVVYCGWTTL